MSPLSPRPLPEGPWLPARPSQGDPSGLRAHAEDAELGVNPRGAGAIPPCSGISPPKAGEQLKGPEHSSETPSEPRWDCRERPGVATAELAPAALPRVFQGKKGCPKERAVLRPRLQWQSSAQGNWPLSPRSATAPPDMLWPEVGLAVAQCGSEGWHSSRRNVPSGCPAFMCLCPTCTPPPGHSH